MEFIKDDGGGYPDFEELWEEIPDEDLWQDGELKTADMPMELFEKVIITGKWKLIRRKNG